MNKEEFLLKLSDPTAYKVHEAVKDMATYYSRYVQSTNIREMAMLSNTSDDRAWCITFKVDFRDYMPLHVRDDIRWAFKRQGGNVRVGMSNFDEGSDQIVVQARY